MAQGGRIAALGMTVVPSREIDCPPDKGRGGAHLRRKVNPLLAGLRPTPELGRSSRAHFGLSFRDAFGTQVGHKDRKRLTRVEEERGAKPRLTWENRQDEQ